jgi:D-xylose transport system substrate-binding protein
MKKIILVSSITTLVALGVLSQAQQTKPVIGVSWSNFQEERWRTDESAMDLAIAVAGGQLISTDAQASSEKQLNDIDTLISRKVSAIIVLALDKDAISPAIAKAKAAKIPIIAYDRLIEDSGVFYLTFDNVEVGRMQAREVLKQKPKGNYVFIKGDPGDPNSNFLHGGQLEVLNPAIKRGDIKVVGEQYTEGWKPENAQRIMEQLLTRNGNKVDAVVASNDGMAGGAVAALASVGLAGKVAVSGQDGDLSALNRVARGSQTVSVWKDARSLGKRAGEIAMLLAKGTPMNKIPGLAIFSKGPNKVRMNSVFIKPVPITKANLNVVLDARWISKDVLCEGVDAKLVPVCKR